MSEQTPGTITPDSIETAFSRLMKIFREQGVSRISPKDDYYSIIAAEQFCDPYQEPKELEFGQLTGDIGFLLPIITGGMSR